MLAFERRPHRLSDIAIPGFEALINQAIRRHGLQHAIARLPCRINQDLTVRCEARRLILLASGQHKQLFVSQVHNTDSIVAAIQRQHRELLAVRRQTRTRIITPFKGNALRRSAVGANAIDLRPARPVRFDGIWFRGQPLFRSLPRCRCLESRRPDREGGG